MSQTTDEVIKEVAKEMGLPIRKVREIVNAQFKFVAHTMDQGAFDSVRVMHLGKFRVNPKRLHSIQNGVIQGLARREGHRFPGDKID